MMILERSRGEKTWNEFLLELVEKVERKERQKAARTFLERYKLNEAEAEKLKELIQERREQWTFQFPKEA